MYPGISSSFLASILHHFDDIFAYLFSLIFLFVGLSSNLFQTKSDFLLSTI